MLLNLKNRSDYQYFSSHIRPEHAPAPVAAANVPPADLKVPVLANYLFSALAGTCWYFQFFFYTMGATQMGNYDFASWTLYMASIIIFSTMWGWFSMSGKAHLLIGGGIATLVLSTIIIGYGTYLKSHAGQ